MKVLFAGEGGQGIQTIAQILAKAAFNEGKSVLYIPNFGVEQRGGVSLAFVVIDHKPVIYPKFEKADILAVIADRCWERIAQHQSKNTKVVWGPATKKGIKTDLPPKVWNILVLGQVNKLGKIVDSKSLIQVMKERFSRQFAKNPKLLKLNLKALT